MAGYAELQRRHRRLDLLRVLAGAPGYEANELILGSALASLGLGASRDVTRADIAWLAEQGLVATEDAGGILVARVTARGLDCANGLAVVPGVARPVPED